MRLPSPLATSVDKLARQTLGREWALYATLLDNWRDIVGEEYALNATPVKIAFPRGAGSKTRPTEGVLHIRLPKGLMMAFSFHLEPIRQRLALCLGTTAISRIVLEPAWETATTSRASSGSGDAARLAAAPPLSKDRAESLHKAAEGIEDTDMRAALESLGATLLRLKRG